MFGYINLRCQMPLEPGISCASEFEAKQRNPGWKWDLKTKYSPTAFSMLSWKDWRRRIKEQKRTVNEILGDSGQGF